MTNIQSYKGAKQKILLIFPYENRLIGKPMQKRNDDIKKDLMEVKCDFMDWIRLVQNRIKNLLLKTQETPWCSINTSNVLTS
jgi:hypothetical protein